MTAGLSLQRYRKIGYDLSATHAPQAIALLGIESAELTKLAEEAEKLWEQSKIVPPGIKTGINGMEM